MGTEILSPFSFYGGKAKMASLICQMLDYSRKTYIEPFGGACRVLLNKPKHLEEIYNDFGAGLYFFFYCMSQKELAKKVISALYDIVPSEEVFYEKREYKVLHETELTDYMRRQFKSFVYRCNRKYHSEKLSQLHTHIIKKDYYDIIKTGREILRNHTIHDKRENMLFRHFLKQYEDYWQIVQPTYDKAYKLEEEYFNSIWNREIEKLADAGELTDKIKKQMEKDKPKYAHKAQHQGALYAIDEYTGDTLISNDSGAGDSVMNPVDMAIATFVTYYMSRDGMGLDYSESKCKSLEAYYRKLLMLEDVAERFEDVVVMQLDAIYLTGLYSDNEDVMIYLDPSYLDPKDASRDLGKGIYNRSFDYFDHERLAKKIQKAKAHILLSNYDVSPYKEYLNEEHGWKRIEFDTTTGVGSKKDNKRVEVLWYNY